MKNLSRTTRLTIKIYSIFMSLVVIIRNYIEYLRPLFYQTNELVKNHEAKVYIDFVQSFFIFLEATIPQKLFSLVTFQWIKETIYIPILRPEIQIARSNSRIFSTIPFYSSDLFPKNLDFVRLKNIIVPTTSFQTGFFNAFFLASPISLITLINIRRYWLQGFTYGLFGTLGYHIGESFFLVRITNGNRFLWSLNGSNRQFLITLVLTVYFLQESYQDNSFDDQNFFQSKEKIQEDSINIKKIFIIFFLHGRYSWSDQRTFFNTIGNQTIDTYTFTSVISYFSIQNSIYFYYLSGLFLGGLLFDLLTIRRFFKRIEYFFVKLLVPPSDWKKKIDIWTKRLRTGCLVRIIPFYRAENLTFSSLGFFGRDTELRRQLSRNIFSYPLHKNENLSPLFEGRNILGGDSYGRSSPDILREPPWLLGRSLAAELTHDLIDETYRTRIASQRVDIVYLGTLERKISEWLELRNQKSIISEDQSSTIQNKKKKREKKKEEEPILVKESVRKGLNPNLTARNTKNYPLEVDPLVNRFNRWFRSTPNIIDLNREKVPNSLFALYIRTSPFLPSFWSYNRRLEPEKAVRYSTPAEFFRKRNARKSFLHRGPIFIYIDLFINTRSPFMGFSRDITTRQQQNDLYRARLILHDYVNSLRRYSEINPNFLENKQKLKSYFPIFQRISWQQKVAEVIFRGNRSRRNSVYNQQYVGNLQLVRRLFAISWSSSEYLVPFRIQTKEKILRRRKLALDQRTFDRQKNIFEHEEIGKVVALKIKNNQERKQISDLLRLKNKKSDRWILIPGKRYFPDFRVERKPLYAGWDRQRNAFILCNRYLPFEWSRRTKLKVDRQRNKFSFYFQNINKYSHEKNRIEFTVWPKNPKTRRMHLHGIHYNRRAFLKRRVATNNKIRIDETAFLSQDPSYWRKKIVEENDLAQFTMRFHPHNNLNRRNRQNRSSQSLPISLERGLTINYFPRKLQPSPRGGLAWPGNNSFVFIPEKFYRPGYMRS
jgi:hypothetical protein